ncbi:cell division protein ZapE [Paraferrimonas sp. SM1919]|uniref:cell division protein ZapE n=1 Tax=Paraferrimonas sp. SM1919 TaxID=2662263 RepID=UPI001F08CDB9|nr:cell division protein ZapE [Paraferrimonas sp. SM1919]
MYRQDIANKGFVEDDAQLNAVKHLQQLYEELCQPIESASWLQKLFSKPALNQQPKGLYFWGGVGRGKTYLVDMFFESLPFDNKLRAHFHRFMQQIHDDLQRLKGQRDPLLIIADEIASKYKVICFDEFFVSDITDAMLLGTLFQALFNKGIVLVATSNIEPKHLYKNGLQRSRFLPAIAAIEENCLIVNVDSGVDYRLRTLTQAEIFHSPLDKQANVQLKQYFHQLADAKVEHNKSIEINHRQINTISVTEGVVLFDFKDLCDGPRSQSDYIELARIYHTVLCANIPLMGKEHGGDDVARRFLAMIDEFYDRNVKFIASGAAPVSNIYQGGALDFEYQRCISRLTEMQSHEYLAKPHLP